MPNMILSILTLLISFSSFASLQIYKEGLELLKQKRFTKAGTKFEEFIKTSPDHALKYRASFLWAESLRRGQNFNESTKAFEKLLQDSQFPGKMRSEILLGLSESYRGLGEEDRANRYLTQILVLFPESKTTEKVIRYYPNLQTRIRWQQEEFAKIEEGNSL